MSYSSWSVSPWNELGLQGRFGMLRCQRLGKFGLTRLHEGTRPSSVWVRVVRIAECVFSVHTTPFQCDAFCDHRKHEYVRGGTSVHV